MERRIGRFRTTNHPVDPLVDKARVLPDPSSGPDPDPGLPIHIQTSQLFPVQEDGAGGDVDRRSAYRARDDFHRKTHDALRRLEELGMSESDLVLDCGTTTYHTDESGNWTARYSVVIRRRTPSNHMGFWGSGDSGAGTDQEHYGQ